MGTVRLSEDDGETFSYSRVVMAGLFGYCSLTQLPDGKIGAFMEIDPDQKALRMVFTRFSLDWIRGKEEDTEVTIDL